MPKSPDRSQAKVLFRARVKSAMQRSHEAFQVDYAEAIDGLQTLSDDEIAMLCPTSADLASYMKLMAVVEEASRMNLAQAELRGHIAGLGAVALRIAGRVPSLARVVA